MMANGRIIIGMEKAIYFFDIIGVFQYADGEKYDGDWLDNKKSGKGNSLFYNYKKGIYAYASGDRYEGEWQDGKRHGKGILYYYYNRKMQLC